MTLTPKIDEWPHFILGIMHARVAPPEALQLDVVRISLLAEPTREHFYVRSFFWQPDGRSFMFFYAAGAGEDEVTKAIRHLLASKAR